ncbi:hypothetical protein EWH99_09155 [Sporolactobacillus sp. THM7-7]|nr:hypothetical protein EWH99_09155 [Sporolactobacillus sp. THM7-7]
MIDQLNRELQNVKEQLMRKKKWERRLERKEASLSLEKIKMIHLKKRMDKEQKDVDKLDRLSVSSLMYSLIGRKPEKMDKEKREAIAARFKYHESAKKVADLEHELAEIRSKMEHVAGAERKYEAILKKKEQLIHDQHSPLSRELYTLVEREAQLNIGIKEYEEAIEAGYRASTALDEAMKSLKNAKNASVSDMFGGGMIATAIKHQRIQASRDEIHEAQRELRRFAGELADIREFTAEKLEDRGFLTFADYFFDGFVVDWFVHKEIRASEQKTSEILRQTNKMLKQLTKQLSDMKKERDQTVRQRIDLLEGIG